MTLPTQFNLCIQVLQDIELDIQVDRRVGLLGTIVALGQVLHRVIRIVCTAERIHFIHIEGRVQLDSLLE